MISQKIDGSLRLGDWYCGTVTTTSVRELGLIVKYDAIDFSFRDEIEISNLKITLELEDGPVQEALES